LLLKFDIHLFDEKKGVAQEATLGLYTLLSMSSYLLLKEGSL
jgi:hypothetical protein